MDIPELDRWAKQRPLLMNSGSGHVSLLETQLGLGGVTVPEALRSAALVPLILQTRGFWTSCLGQDS